MFFDKKKHRKPEYDDVRKRYELIVNLMTYDIYLSNMSHENLTPLPFDVFVIDDTNKEDLKKSVFSILNSFGSLNSMMVWTALATTNMSDADFKERIFNTTFTLRKP